MTQEQYNTAAPFEQSKPEQIIIPVTTRPDNTPIATVSTINSEVITDRITTSTLKSEMLEKQTIIPEEKEEAKSNNNSSKSRMQRHSNHGSVANKIMIETKEWLYKQANANNWYKWVVFTGEQIKAKDCYVKSPRCIVYKK